VATFHGTVTALEELLCLVLTFTVIPCLQSEYHMQEFLGGTPVCGASVKNLPECSHPFTTRRRQVRVEMYWLRNQSPNSCAGYAGSVLYTLCAGVDPVHVLPLTEAQHADWLTGMNCISNMVCVAHLQAM